MRPGSFRRIGFAVSKAFPAGPGTPDNPRECTSSARPAPWSLPTPLGSFRHAGGAPGEASDGLIYVAMPRVMTGLMFGVAAWLLITATLRTLGVIHCGGLRLRTG